MADGGRGPTSVLVFSPIGTNTETQFLRLDTRSEEWLQPLFSNLTAVFTQAFISHRIIYFTRAMSVTFGRKTRITFKIATPVLIFGTLFSLGASLLIPVYFTVGPIVLTG